MNRRYFVSTLCAAATGSLSAAPEKLPPVRAITRGPKFHWFGYYDKLQFDPASRYALGMEGSFEHRMPAADDTVRLGMVDTADGDRWIDLGVSHSWSWHQGCMLQWLPGSSVEAIYNDRLDGHFVSHIVNVKTGKRRTLPMPIYAVSPDARWAVVNDLGRSYDLRPETGYAGIPDPNREVLAPKNSGIWRVDLTTGKYELILSTAEVAAIPGHEPYGEGARHYFEHLLYSPDGRRFTFFQRWKGKGEGAGFATRMLSADPDGRNIRVLNAEGKTSHYNWRDPGHLLVWMYRAPRGEAWYILDETTGKAEAFAPEGMTRDGHVSYLPGNRWVVSDTSPDKERLQHPYLYDSRTGKQYPLGHLYSAPEYKGVWRCDTTPRFSPDSRKVVVDSPHGGNGRQMYLFDISGIVSQ